MASTDTRVFFLGGESFTPAKNEDYGVFHVLDTSSHFATNIFPEIDILRLLQNT
jgi:hypothetical protein